MMDFQDRASWCCPRSREGQKGLRVILLMGRRGERFVEPGHQIAMGEYVHAQQRHEIRQAPAETGGQLQIAQQQHRAQCGPHLGLDRVRRGADEGLDLQVLFERFEEQLDLPAILVDGGDGGSAEAVMIGEKHQGVSRVLADRLNPAQQMRTLVVGTGAGQADGLIRDDVPVLRHRVFLDHLEQGVVFHAGDEIDAGIRPFGEQPVVVVAPVINHDGAGHEGYVPGGLDVGDCAVSYQAEARQIAVVVEHQVQLNGTFSAAVLRPIVHRQAQVDHGRVEADPLVLEAERVYALRLGGDRLEQSVEALLEQLPRTVAVRVGQRGTDRDVDAQVGQLAFAALQPAFDLPPRMGAAQLTEQHANKLAPARQALTPIFGPRCFDDALEVGARDELEYLTAHAA
jgi:hypothetical protein